MTPNSQSLHFLWTELVSVCLKFAPTPFLNSFTKLSSCHGTLYPFYQEYIMVYIFLLLSIKLWLGRILQTHVMLYANAVWRILFTGLCPRLRTNTESYLFRVFASQVGSNTSLGHKFQDYLYCGSGTNLWSSHSPSVAKF